MVWFSKHVPTALHYLNMHLTETSYKGSLLRHWTKFTSGPLHLPHLDVNLTTASPWPKKLRLARQEDISCLNSLGISNFRENLPCLPDSLAGLSFWVDYGGSGLGQVDMSGGQMALPIIKYWYALVYILEFLPSTIQICEPEETAYADWPVTCTCCE